MLQQTITTKKVSLSNSLDQSIQWGLDNRRDSYHQSLPSFKRQDNTIFACIYSGLDNSEAISNRCGILLTSVRRSLSDLKRKNFIVETGRIQGSLGRTITTYAIAPAYSQIHISREEIRRLIEDTE